MSKKIGFANLMYSESNIKILQEIDDAKGPMQFKTLRDLKNPKTNKKFSSSTIASKLKELEEGGLLENEVVQTKSKKVLGYVLTDTGKSALSILRETEQKLKRL